MHNSTLFVLDSRVFHGGLLQSAVLPNVAAITLDPDQDGLRQITEALGRQGAVRSLHILCHGSPGCLHLGNGHLGLDNLALRSQELKGWFAGVDSPQLFLYGCNVAAGDAGAEFVEKLAGLTEAGVSASTTAIGHQSLGGNWVLDFQTGDIVVENIFSAPELAAYPGVLDGNGEWFLFDLVDSSGIYTERLDALQLLVQEQLSDFFAQSDYLTQLAIPFSATAGTAGWTGNAESLRSSILDGNYQIRLEVRSSAELQGALGAYSATGTTGTPTIYLNVDWFATASQEQIVAVLLEEIGHDFDQILNDGADSQGDEGEIFANVVRGGDYNLDALKSQNDHQVLDIGNYSVAVEKADLNTGFQSFDFTFTNGSNGDTEIIDSATSTTRRYSNVITVNGIQVDAIVTATRTNISSFTFDANDNPTRLEPGIDPTTNGRATFVINFVEGGTSTPISLFNFSLSAVDIDGGVEFYEIQGYSFYEVDITTGLTVTEPSPGIIRVASISGNLDGRDFDNSASIIADYLVPVSTVTVVAEVSSSGNERLFSFTLGNRLGEFTNALRFTSPGQLAVPPLLDLNFSDGSPQSQVTRVTFSPSYDVGDIVSITVDGFTYSHTVVSGNTSAEAVYDALKAVTVGGITLANRLISKGVSWPANLTSNAVILTSNPGAANAFTLTTAITSGPALPWIYTVDFADDITDFANSPNENITIVINGVSYVGTQSTNAGNSNGRFDRAADDVVADIDAALGVGTASYDSGNNTFTITLSASAAITATSTGVNDDNDQVANGTVNNTQAGTSPTSQPAPSVNTTSTAANGNTGYQTTFSLGGAPVAIGDTDVSVTDADSPNMNSATITLTNAQVGDLLTVGSLPSGVTSTINTSIPGQIIVTLSGNSTRANYETAIEAITFSTTSTNTTARTINVIVNDGINTSNTAIAIVNVISAVNNAPVNTLPATFSVNEDTNLTLSGLSISDVDAGTGNVTVTLSVNSGTLSASSGGNVTVTDSGTGSITLTGTVANINTFLGGGSAPVFSPSANFNGAVTLTMVTNDGGNTGSGGPLSDTDTSTITVLDTTAPIISITLDDVTADNVVNAAEAGGNVAITGTVGGEFNTGDTVTLVINSNNYTGTVDGSGNFSIDVPGSDLVADGDLTIDASVATTDAAGNPGSANDTQTYSVDTTAPIISINTIASDDIINAAEAGSPVAVSGTTTGVENGQTVTVTIDGNTYTTTVSNNIWTLNVPVADIANFEGSETVTADVSNLAGNAATQATRNITIDTTAPIISITLDDVTADNVVNAAEAGGNVAITGTVGGEFNTGDTVTLVINSNNYTGTVDGSGNFSIDVPGSDLVADGDLTIDASVATTDAAGNPGSANDTQTYSVDTTAPIISINTIASDDIINAAEAGSPVAVSGTTTGVENGQTVTVTIDGNTYTTTVSNNTWTLNVPVADIANFEGSETVTADVSNLAGNAATQATRNITIDTTAPIISITLDDVTADNVVNAAEAGGNVAITGTVGGEFNTGDTVTLVINSNNYTGTVDGSGNFSIDVPGSDLVADGDLTIDASVATTDAAGNPGSANDTQTYSVDTTAPIISINTIASDDIINAAEAGSPVAVSGTTTGVENGQTVTVTIDGNTYTTTVSNNTWTLNVPVADIANFEGSETVTADVSNLAGNAATQATRNITIDTTAPIISITLDDVTADNVVNAAEAGGNVAITGTVGGEFNTGDTVTLVINSNNYTGTVDGSGNFSIDVPGSDLVADGDLTIDASVATTDAAGNPGSANDTQTYSVDTTAPIISINTIASDDIINAAEAGSPVAVSGTTTGVENGQTVTVTIDGNTYTTTVSNNTWTLNVPVADIANFEGSETVTADVSNLAGNAATQATRNITIDTTAPIISITLDDVTADNVVNAAEAGGNVAITGTVGGEFNTGDTVTLVINSNNYTGTVDGSGNFSIDVPGSDLVADGDLTIDASVATTDAAGNPGSANDTQTYSVDTTAPIISITLDDVTADNVVNAAEAGGNVAITGTVGGEFNTGDTVTLVINSNNYTGTVDGSGNFSIDVPGSDLVADGDLTIDASVATTDAAGNPGSANDTQTYSVDTTAPIISITLDDVTADNVVNAAEAGGNVAITGTVGGEFNTGDTVTLVINSNNYTGTVDGSGNFSIDVPGSDLVADGDLTIDASVATTDAAGNPGSANDTQTYSVDTTAPIISINTIASDDIINAAEAGSPVAVSGTTTGVENGQTVTVTIDGNTYTTTVSNNIWTLNVPVADIANFEGSETVTADVSNLAGNAATQATRNITIDTTAPIISITLDDVTADNVVNAAEAGGNVAITGTVGGEFNTGDTVTLVINSNNYTGTVDGSGNFSIDVPGSDLVADGDLTIDASVATTDAAGNPGSANDTQTYSVDTTAPIISINTIASDDIINAAEAGSPVAVSGTTTGVENGQTVTVTIDGNTYTTTVSNNTWTLNVPVADIANFEGSETVTADVSNLAGNAATQATRNITIDTTAPIISITLDDVTADNVVNAAEAGGNVAITGTVGGEFNTGDTVTLVINSNNYTGTVDGSGNFSIDVPGSDLVADGDLTIDASVATTDAAGNPGSANDTQTYSVDTTAPIISINTIASDDIINAAEAGSPVAVSGTTTGVENGQTVTVTIDGNTYTTTVSNNTWTLNVPVADIANFEGSETVTADVSNLAGNAATQATRNITIDTTAPIISITLDDVTADNVVNAAEAGGNVAITGTVGGEFNTGDTVTLVINSNNYTGTVDGSGNFSIDVPGSDLVADGDLTIDASVATTDAAGNPGSANDTQTYSVDTTAPIISINTIASDDIINAAEAGSPVAVSGTTTGVENGQTVTVTIDGNTYTTTVSNNIWTLNVPVADIANFEGSETVTADVSNLAGNAATQATRNITIDTTAPIISITLDDVTADNVVNAAEAGGNVAITGTVGGEFNTGDTVTLVINSNNYTGTVDGSGNFSIDVPGSDLVADGDLTIDASVATTDAAGNPGSANDTQTYSVDTTAPIISINTIASDDIINAAEAGSPVAVSGTTTGVENGQTVTVTIDGNTYTTTVSNNTWTLNVPVADIANFEGSETVTADVSNLAGNAATQATRNITIDTTAPIISITLDDVTADNVVNAAEAGGNVAITGTVGGEFNTGDTVTLVINSNNYTGTVDGSGNFSIDVPGSDLVADGDLTIDASVATTDAAGNPGSANDTQTYSVDTTAPIISINTIASDDIINAAEAGSPVAVSGTTTGVENGQTVTVTIDGNTYTTTVSNNIWTLNVPVADIANFEGSETVTADVSNLAGNAATQATRNITIDTTAPIISITLDDVTADNVVNAAEAGGNVAITGTVGGEFNTGDTVTLVINSNNYTGTVDGSGNFSIDVPGSDLVADGDLTIDASVATTDAAGNPGSANDTQTYSVDTTAPIISINTIASDDIINAAEAGSPVAVSGTTTGVENGQTVTVTIDGNTYTTTVSNNTWTLNVPVADIANFEGSETVTADVSNLAGNAATQATRNITIDTTAPIISITLDDVTADNVVNAAEAGGNVAITGTVGGEFNTGDTVTLVINSNNYTGTVDGSGNFSIDVPGSDLVADGDLTIDASVATTDAAGNPGSANDTQTYSVDTTAPIISINTIASDDIINAAEAGSPVAVSGTTTGVENGQTVTVTIDGNTYTTTVSNNIWTLNVPVADIANFEGSETVTADVSNLAGNAATQATRNITIDTTAPIISITLDDVTADNVVNAAEAGGNVAITGTVGGEFNTGDTVTLVINSNNYTGTVDGSGNFSIDVPGSDLVADGDLTIDASVATTDAAGNPGSANDTQTYSVDTTAPIISINTIASDDIINAAEAGSPVAVSGTTTGVENGQTVTVTIDGNTYTTTVSNNIWTLNVPVADIANFEGSETVTADVSNLAGNAATQATRNITIDTTAPIISITLDDVTADNVVNAAEAGGNVAITGTVGGEFNTGDTVTLVINSNNYTGTVDGSGNFSIDVPGSDLVADGDLTIDASVATTDAAGNPGSANDTQTYSVDTTAPIISITLDDVTADNVVNAAEAGGNVAITGTVGGEFNTGDTVTLVINSNNYTGTVDGSGNFSIDVPGSDLVADGDLTIDASVATTDAAGNPGSANDTQTYSVDTTAPIISINTIASDDIINAAEAGSPVAVSGTTTGVENGQTVTVTIDGNTYTTTVSNNTWTLNVPVADIANFEGSETVTADVSNLAGNAATQATRNITIDTTAPIISITSISNDTGIVGDFITSDQTLVYGGTADTGATVTVTLRDNNNNVVFSTTTNADGNGDWNLDRTTNEILAGGNYTLTVSTTDLAGNTATDTQAITIDTNAPGITITAISIDSGTAGDFATNDQTLVITGTWTNLPTNTLAVIFNGTTYTLGIDSELIVNGNNWTLDLSAITTPPGDYTLTATATDLANNIAQANQNITIDTTAPGAPVVTITEDANNDGTISAGELNGLVDVLIALPTGLVAGDTLTISDGNTPQAIVLTTAQINAGVVTTQVAVPAPSTTLTVTAFVTDSAGNQSTSGSDSAVLDTIVPPPPPDLGVPVVTITEDANNDGTISAGELNGLVDVSIALPTGLVAGDTLTISDGNTPQAIVLTTAQINAGVVTTQVAVPNPGASLTVSAFITDNAGNQGPDGSDSAVLNTTAPNVGPLDISDATDTGADDLLSSDGNPELTFTGEPGLEIGLLGPDGNPVDADAYEVVETPGANPGEPSTYTIKLIDADPSDPDSDPFGDFFNGVVTGNGANTGDGIYIITATDNAGNTNDVGQFEIDTTSPGTPNNGNSPFSPLDISDATDTGADDLLSSDGNPELTFTGEPGLEIGLLGPDGNPVDPGAYEVVETPGANPGDPSTYTIKLIDADPSDPDSDPFGDFFNGVVTGNGANTGDGIYIITATDNAGNTNDVGQFEIDTTSPGTPNNGNSPFSPLDISDATDTGADDLLSSDGNPELTFTGEPGLEIGLLGPDGNPVDPGAYEVVETPGANPGEPSTYTIKLIDADPSDPDSDPFGDFFNGVVTGNGANTGDGIYIITATDNAGNTNDVGQFEIDTTSPGTPNNGNSPFSPLDISDSTDTGADDLLSSNGNPELTFTGEPGLEIGLLGPDGNPVDPGAYKVVETPGANPGDPSTYTIKLIDADPSDPDSDPLGDFFNGVVTGNPANTGDGTYTITATDNAGNTNDVGQFEIKTSSLISINDDRGTVVIGDLGFGSVNVDVLANDQGLGIQIASLTQPFKGTAVLRDNDTPNNFSDDFLTYHIHEELLDLRPATGLVRVDLSNITSRASYNNSVGFYQVLDHFGTIIDPTSGRLLTPADPEYRNIALASAIAGLQISVNNPVQSIELPGGGIYAPFLTSDQGNGQVNHFFALIDANPGQVDYVRFANNVYSFEDTTFGDRDFNDLRFGINILPQGDFVPQAIGLTTNTGVFTANGLVDQFTYTITDVNGDNRTATVAIDNQEHLKFTIVEVDGDFKNEVAIFRVDDTQGTINGIAPGQAGYLEAALSNSQVIFTGISGQTQLFGESLTRTMDQFQGGDSFGFLLIQNNSLDMVLREQASGGISTPIFFSQAIANGNQIQQISNGDDEGMVVAWEDIAQGGDGDFNDFVFRVAMTSQPAPLGTFYQGQAQQEIFANTSNQNAQIGIQITTNSFYDNTVGFYLVENAGGTVLDYTSGQLVNPGDANYAEVAVRQRLSLGSNGQPIGGELSPGQIIAPFLISNGTENQFLTVNPANQAIAVGPVAFFNYVEANPDKIDHFRLIADNTFAIEDTLGGGDFSFDDIIVKLIQTAVNPELLDLRSLDGPVNLGINEITSDASFGLSVGFYRVENQFGAITDPLTGQILNPGHGNYQSVALQNTAAQFTVNAGTSSQVLQLAGGSLFAPYLTVSQSDGSVFNYFSYLGANPDQADHIRVWGDTFQFEDGFWGEIWTSMTSSSGLTSNRGADQGKKWLWISPAGGSRAGQI
ncbi:Ig-like domain-containing protein [Synechocystis sp. PCC 7339]|uniref:Ig-like domain-containing protein n=1 Tax=Synechocystis sp. PCC 7339 TaxID=2782213 RepID=UPI001CBD617B|nr:Ig-like domain-containing protein [Synechocystis sp. PCC 7339]UAJ73308.1 Ig-like domain-containing protein [Synechocystis sp. PCC 7339]